MFLKLFLKKKFSKYHIEFYSKKYYIFDTDNLVIYYHKKQFETIDLNLKKKILVKEIKELEILKKKLIFIYKDKKIILKFEDINDLNIWYNHLTFEKKIIKNIIYELEIKEFLKNYKESYEYHCIIENISYFKHGDNEILNKNKLLIVLSKTFKEDYYQILSQDKISIPLNKIIIIGEFNNFEFDLEYFILKDNLITINNQIFLKVDNFKDTISFINKLKSNIDEIKQSKNGKILVNIDELAYLNQYIENTENSKNWVKNKVKNMFIISSSKSNIFNILEKILYHFENYLEAIYISKWYNKSFFKYFIQNFNIEYLQNLNIFWLNNYSKLDLQDIIDLLNNIRKYNKILKSYNVNNVSLNYLTSILFEDFSAKIYYNIANIIQNIIYKNYEVNKYTINKDIYQVLEQLIQFDFYDNFLFNKNLKLVKIITEKIFNTILKNWNIICNNNENLLILYIKMDHVILENINFIKKIGNKYNKKIDSKFKISTNKIFNNIKLKCLELYSYQLIKEIITKYIDIGFLNINIVI